MAEFFEQINELMCSIKAENSLPHMEDPMPCSKTSLILTSTVIILAVLKRAIFLNTEIF
jgi:hypothetical protein